MKTIYYLVEFMNGSEYNIYSGSETECNSEMKRILKQFGDKSNSMYITSNRFN